VLASLFKLLIEGVYIDYLSGDEFFSFNPNLLKYVVGFGVTLGLACLIIFQTRKRPIMHVTMSIFFIFLAIPILSYFALADRTWVYPTLVVGSFLLTLQFSRLPLVDIRQRAWLTRRTTSLLIGLIIGQTILLYAIIVSWYGSPPISPLFFENTYEIRAMRDPAFSSVRFLGSPLFGYLFNWQIKLFNPLLLGVFFKKGRYRLVGVVVFLTVLGYMYFPNTLYIMVPMFVIIVLLLFRYQRVLTGMLTLGIGGVVVAYLIYNFGDITTFLYQVVGRGLYVEARNEFYFYQWFQTNPPMYLTDTPLNPFWEYPYEQRVTYLYSDKYLGTAHNANTGYLADGYGQFGAVGTLGVGIAVGALLWLLDSLASHMDPEIVVVLAAIPMFNLTQSDLTSSILTNGLLLVVVISLAYTMDSRRCKKRNINDVQGVD